VARDIKIPSVETLEPRETIGSIPKLPGEIYELLQDSDLGRDDLPSALPPLQVRYGDELYSELIFALSHLRFDAAEARQHWLRIAAHRETMQQRLGSPVDLRVALISYFLELDPKLENLMLIELRLFERKQASAYRDELTGLCNFPLLKEHLDREILRGDRYNAPLSLIMVDADDFKDYNEHNGHQAGNEALVTIAGLLGSSLRKVDVAARYGGDVFTLMLPSTGKTDAYRVAERARELIESHPFSFQQHQPGSNLTVSMGIATFPGDADDSARLVECADRALYVAKSNGKNRIHPYGDNRRSYRRIEAVLDGECCVLSAGIHALRTVNISEGGLLVHIDRRLPIGALTRVSLKLPEIGRDLETTGRVVRVEDRGSGRYEAAIRILELSAADQHALTSCIARLSEEKEESTER
jgi:diguanylate cyclase (GGDEF)-like protein